MKFKMVVFLVISVLLLNGSALATGNAQYNVSTKAAPVCGGFCRGTQLLY